MTTSNDGIPIISDFSLPFLTDEAINDAKSRYAGLQRAFQAQYGTKPHYYIRAPGRVNLIGEHIDYEGYSVFPMAIAKEIVLAISIPNDTTQIELANIESTRFPTRRLPMDPSVAIDRSTHDWSHYFQCGYKGAWILNGYNQHDNIFGVPMQIMVAGNIPLASGLSSSSAFVVASTIATLIAAMHWKERHDVPKSWNNVLECHSATHVADLCRRAEQFIGTLSGGMDQAIACLGRHGMACMIDFCPLQIHAVPLPSNCVIVVADSLTVAEKAVSATTHYNKRVVECMLASKLLAKCLLYEHWAAVSTLKDVHNAMGIKSLDKMIQLVDEHLVENEYTLQTLQKLLDTDDLASIMIDKESNANATQIQNVLKDSKQSLKLRQRAQHVYSEAARVYAFKSVCEAIAANGSQASQEQLQELGDLANASQESCRELYECSSPELDELTELARNLGAVGSRLTGAGWGGSTVSFVPESKVADFLERIKTKYYINRGIQDVDGHVFACKPMMGASVMIASSIFQHKSLDS